MKKKKQKEKQFSFYVFKVRRVHGKYLAKAAYCQAKPLKATQRIIDTMTDKDRRGETGRRADGQTERQIG